MFSCQYCNRTLGWLGLLILLATTNNVAVRAIAQDLSSSNAPAVATTQPSPTSSHAVITAAEYTAVFADNDLSSGTLQWELTHRGPDLATIDISETNLAIQRLRAGNADVAWGTTRSDQRIVISTPNLQSISGNWSFHGRQFPGVTVFDCKFPPALSSKLRLLTSTDMVVRTSAGYVTADDPGPNSAERNWTIDLGRHRNVTLSLLRKESLEIDAEMKVEIDTVHVARRDGIFAQCDFSIEGLLNSKPDEFLITVPSAMEVQTVTSSNVPIAFARQPDDPSQIRISVPAAVVRGRVGLRIQGFQPVRWVRPHRLPVFALKGAIETKRATSIRVESPLELHQIRSDGYFQVGLTNERRGEVWRFEAYQENPQITLELGMPTHELRADIHTLHMLDTPLPWTASRVTATTKSGRLFEMSVSIPNEWTVVSVIPRNIESEMSSWSIEQNQLQVNFKSPIDPDSRKSIEILARGPAPGENQETRLSVPVILAATSTSIQSDWVLPAALDIDLIGGPIWNSLTSPIDFSPFQSATSTQNQNQPQTHRSYFASNVNLATLPNYRIFRKTQFDSVQLESEESAQLTITDDQLKPNPLPPPTAHLSVVTHAEPSATTSAPRLVHHSTLEIFGKAAPQALHLTLPIDCQLSSVSVDGKSVTVFREGEKILFPEDITELSELSLIYVSETEQQWLRQFCDVPLPEISLTITRANWNLELSRERFLSHIQLPNTQAEQKTHHFILGPLSKNLASSRWSPDVAGMKSPLDFSGNHSEHSTIWYHFEGLAAPERIQFESWDARRAINISWIVFFACLTVGIGGRLSGVTLVRRASPFWLIILIVMQVVSVNEWSMISGGMLAGTLISLLLPIQLLRLSLRRLPQPSVKFSQLAQAPAVALVAVTSLMISPAYGQELTDSRQTHSEVPYLLKAVEYKEFGSNALKTYRARLEVLVPADQVETLVELPYEGVVFQMGAECLVDGVTTTLIPATDGAGVIVRIPNKNEPDPQSVETGWIEHFVEFDFTFRVTDPAEGERPFQAAIPRIIDTQLQPTLREPRNPLLRLGQWLSDEDGTTKVALGPVDQLRTTADLSDEGVNYTLYTHLNISPARVQGQLFLAPQSETEARDLLLKVPPRVLVTNVSGTSVKEWFLTADRDDQTRLVVEHKPTVPMGTTVISFSMRTILNTNGEIFVPSLNWGGEFEKEIVGIRSPTGTFLEVLPNQNDYTLISLEAWPQNEIFGRHRPSQVLQKSGVNELKLNLRQTEARSNHSIVETLSVERTRLSWNADLEIEIQDLPIFVHHMTTRGGLRISSVRSGDVGQNSSLRFHQTGNQLLIYLSGGQLGSRKLQLFGEAPFSPEVFYDLPGINFAESRLKQQTLTLLDKTNWDIELEMPGGTQLQEPSISSDDFTDVRTIAVYSANAKARPTRLRLLPPPSATRVDVATRLQVGDRKQWNLVQLLRFSGEQTPLKKIVFSVPDSLENVRIGPRDFRSQKVVHDGSVEFSIVVPDRYTDGATIQIYSRLSEEIVANILQNPTSETPTRLPEIDVESARVASRLFFLNDNPLVTTPASGSLPIESKNLPSWIPLQWRESVASSRLSGYQVIDEKIQLSLLTPFVEQEQAQLRFAETAIWPQSDQSTAGITRLWINRNNAVQYLLPFQEDVEVTHVYQEDRREVAVRHTPEGRQIDIAIREPVTSLTVHWRMPVDDTQQIRSPLSDQMLTEPKQSSLPHLLGVIENHEFTMQGRETLDLSEFDTWMYRWKALLEIARGLQNSLSVESHLHQSIRECQAVFQEMQSQTILTPEQQKTTKELQAEWKDVLEQIVISVESVSAGSSETSARAGLLVDVQNSFQKVRWNDASTSEPFSATLVVEKSKRPWLRWGGSLLIVALVIMAAWKFRWSISRLVSLGETNPVISLLLLGSIWFFFLEPVFLSLVILSTAFVFHWLTAQPERQSS